MYKKNLKMFTAGIKKKRYYLQDICGLKKTILKRPENS